MGHRYIGSKTQILEEVIEGIERIVGANSCVADLMCGTGAVSGGLKLAGHQVVANDIMTYSYHHARVLLEFTKEPVFRGAKKKKMQDERNFLHSLVPLSPYEEIIDTLNALKPRKEYFYKEFSQGGIPAAGVLPRNYFSIENASKIDAIRRYIAELQDSKHISKLEYSLLIHDLVMAANDVANIAGTYGHFLSKLAGRANTPLILRPTKLHFEKRDIKHVVYQGRAEDVAKKIEADLCYIDPPYIKRQYAANYHVLETLARGDHPEAIGISGLRPWRDQYSNFCTKTKIFKSFEEIITRCKSRNFLISYSEDGLIKISQLQEFFSNFGKVKVSQLQNKRFKSNKNGASGSLTEYLIHIKK